jgi:hypothetical protein
MAKTNFRQAPPKNHENNSESLPLALLRTAPLFSLHSGSRRARCSQQWTSLHEPSFMKPVHRAMSFVEQDGNNLNNHLLSIID